MSKDMGSSPGGRGKMLSDFCQNDLSQGSTTASAPRSCCEQTKRKFQTCYFNVTTRTRKHRTTYSIETNVCKVSVSQQLGRQNQCYRSMVVIYESPKKKYSFVDRQLPNVEKHWIIGELAPDHPPDRSVQLVGLRVGRDVAEVFCRKNWTFGMTNPPRPRLRTASCRESLPEDFAEVKISRNSSCCREHHLNQIMSVCFTEQK